MESSRMAEAQLKKKIKTWSIKDRFKLAKALSKDEVWAKFATLIGTKYGETDVAEYKPKCGCQCDCTKCGRIGNNLTLKLGVYSPARKYCGNTQEY